MQEKIFYSTTAGIFAVIAMPHFLRMTFAWEAAIGGWNVPMWVSGIAVIVGIYLSYQSFRLRRRLNNRGAQP